MAEADSVRRDPVEINPFEITPKRMKRRLKMRRFRAVQSDMRERIAQRFWICLSSFFVFLSAHSVFAQTSLPTGAEPKQTLHSVGRVSYRCMDSSLSEGQVIVAPKSSILSLCGSLPLSDTQLKTFVLTAGNEFSAEVGQGRPFRRGERFCRFHGGLAFEKHDIDESDLRALLKDCPPRP